MNVHSCTPWLSLGCLVLLLQLVGINDAWAHRLHIFPEISSETVTITASFARNAPVVGARVSVRDSHGNTLHRGVTDDQGRLRFAVRRAQEMRITVDDGAGHRSTLTITRERLLAAGVSDPGDQHGHGNAEPSHADLHQRLDTLAARVAELEHQHHHHGEGWRYASGILLLLALILAARLWQRRSPA